MYKYVIIDTKFVANLCSALSWCFVVCRLQRIHTLHKLWTRNTSCGQEIQLCSRRVGPLSSTSPTSCTLLTSHQKGIYELVAWVPHHGIFNCRFESTLHWDLSSSQEDRKDRKKTKSHEKGIKEIDAWYIQRQIFISLY